MPTERKIQLLLADDEEMVRLGVKSLLAGTEIKVVAEAATGQAAVKLALEKEIDLALLDVRMPDGDGLTALSRIRLDNPEVPVLLFSAFDNPASIAKAVPLGASGFLLKGCTRNELLGAIHTALAGENIWTKEKLHSTAVLSAGIIGSLEVFLTERKGDVLQQMALGLTNKQIALALNIKSYGLGVRSADLLRKIGVTDRTQGRGIVGSQKRFGVIRSAVACVKRSAGRKRCIAHGLNTSNTSASGKIGSRNAPFTGFPCPPRHPTECPLQDQQPAAARCDRDRITYGKCG